MLNIKASLISVAMVIFVLTGCKNNESVVGVESVIIPESYQKISDEKVEEYAVEAPPLSEGIFPCTDCHNNFAPNPVRRELVEWHDDISAIFNHDSENRWCLDCHDMNKRDSLRLANGRLLSFSESYKLCGQCHGDKLRDWKVGVHGKRTGEWNGKKEYLLCVHCHNPHSPRFNEITPDPPPVNQEDIKLHPMNEKEENK